MQAPINSTSQKPYQPMKSIPVFTTRIMSISTRFTNNISYIRTLIVHEKHYTPNYFSVFSLRNTRFFILLQVYANMIRSYHWNYIKTIKLFKHLFIVMRLTRREIIKNSFDFNSQNHISSPRSFISNLEDKRFFVSLITFTLGPKINMSSTYKHIWNNYVLERKRKSKGESEQRIEQKKREATANFFCFLCSYYETNVTCLLNKLAMKLKYWNLGTH